MVFLYNEDAGKELLKLRGEDYKYLVKVRRHKTGDLLHFRNENEPEILYTYIIGDITQRELFLHLQSKEILEVKPLRELHIGWCVVDPKTIEKALPSLNEIGVAKISFTYCKRSQKNFKPDMARLHRILRASNQQCGRSSFMEFSTYKDLPSFLNDYPDVKVFDFGGKTYHGEFYNDVLIGCEGGFSEEERVLFNKENILSFQTPLVLKSESAALGIAAKILL